uniref:Uncharacterized protein n=1 Tax=Malurus cyaneus samueli TaxID=2593467 RepID=A0A8C5T8W0_9PASS
IKIRLCTVPLITDLPPLLECQRLILPSFSLLSLYARTFLSSCHYQQTCFLGQNYTALMKR